MPINNPDARTWFTMHETVSGAPVALDVDQYPDGSFAFRAPFSVNEITVTMKTTLPQAVFALFQIGALLPPSHYVGGWKGHTLVIQTFPDQRADKQKKPGEVNAADVTAKLLLHTVFWNIVVYDPHSDVFVKVLHNAIKSTDGHDGVELSSLTVMSSLDCFIATMERENGYQPSSRDFVVAVDEGAKARAEAFSKHYGTGIIYADKMRDLEGRIVGHKIVSAQTPDGVTVDIQPSGASFWVIDDLCDGGRTFVSIAELLRSTYTFYNLRLYVTHGLFSQGKDELLKHYTEVLSLFDYSNQ
jgi:ribose-phosphate pyrophosphokinase